MAPSAIFLCVHTVHTVHSLCTLCTRCAHCALCAHWQRSSQRLVWNKFRVIPVNIQLYTSEQRAYWGNEWNSKTWPDSWAATLNIQCAQCAQCVHKCAQFAQCAHWIQKHVKCYKTNLKTFWALCSEIIGVYPWDDLTTKSRPGNRCSRAYFQF